jgi:lipopolysaccharide biosynthesis protein
MVSLIQEEFPFAEVRVVHNVGRDVRPFMEILDDGTLDKFDIVCKIHGKKSLRNGRPSALGELWRRCAFIELVCGDGRLNEVVDRFSSDPRLGLLGPERFRIPNKSVSQVDAWSGNEDLTREVSIKVGLPILELDYFAGTMFWVRPQALGALRNKCLSDIGMYPPESGGLNGGLEHALERLFNAAVIADGFEIGSLPPIVRVLGP